ncbi:MAG: HAMP domain-containing sensor histidine kinase [Cellvibrio sp.]|uniref:sensor histidine kinase n=1 Tax=Cellvibrio sp. TaxID=1965322 RepID=UPI0031B34497
MLIAIGLQSFGSQYLIEHKFWVDMLKSISTDHAARVNAGQADSLPSTGIVRSWYLENGVQEENKTTTVPTFLRSLPPGAYSTEDGYGTFISNDMFKGMDTFHALVVDLPNGKLITMLDIGELEDQQNRDSVTSTIWIGVLVILIGGMMAWLHANLVRPVRDLAERMQAINPQNIGARVPTTYKREEIQIIAQASNAHLERVEKFIERERSLLDQASHEFRTPIAVISGAVDVLKQIALPDASKPALTRIENAVADLSETMVALLYLAREATPEAEPADVTVLHELLPRLIQDHEHLLGSKSARLKLGDLEPTFITAPEAMVRIAVSNLIRNAIENTDAGFVELKLQKSVISVADSGSGFNPVEAARRYRDSLRQAAPIRGQGLGLFLIGRICDRFGWELAIQSTATGGTHATLDVSASTIKL